MPIASGDVKFFASRNMSDAPEGAGGPSGVVIPDAANHAVFPGISELDRTRGRVNIRQTVLGVTTPDTAVFLGTNVIIAEPPNDPRVSIVMVEVDDLFAKRDDIKKRIESYLAGGSSYPAYLFGDMLQGQTNISICQREGVPLPNIGDRLVLRKLFGQPGEVEQFVAITSVSNLVRVFTDGQGDFVRNIVALGISERLEADFPGFDAQRIDPSVDDLRARTGLNEAVVADAARFYGTVPLAEPASIGDYTVRATTIHQPIVPSAQVETPIADASTNGMAYALVAAGGPVVQTITTIWTPTQSLYIGGSQLPGSVTIERDGVVITDKGGRLLQSGAEVGAMDYDNGIASLSADVFGSGGGVHTITATPAAMPQAAQRSIGTLVTMANRSLNYVVTLIPPARRSLVLHYMHSGRWYMLREDGSGALRGLDSSYGVGNLNRTTGTLLASLGFLPDVGSAIILQWAEETAAPPVPNTALRMAGKLYVPINTSGQVSEAPGSRVLSPGLTTLTWKHTPSGPTYTASDDGNGFLTGDASGVVDYQRGLILLAPNVLPPVGAVVSINQSSAAASTLADVTWTGSSASISCAITPNTVPGSVHFSLWISVTASLSGLPGDMFLMSEPTRHYRASVRDNGAGGLVLQDGQACGTINNSTGAVTVNMAGVDASLLAASVGARAQLMQNHENSGPYAVGGGYAVGWVGASVSSPQPPGVFTFTVGAPVAEPMSVTIDRFMTRVSNLAEGFNLQGVSFALNGQRYVGANTGVLLTDINPATGAGVPVGAVSAALGVVQLNTWATAAANVVTDWRAIQAPPSSGNGDLSANMRVLFRTTTAPIRPGSFSIVGTMDDGTPINVTAGVNGKIDGARVKGTINFEYGVCELVFCSPVPNALGTVDLSHMQIPGVGVVNLDVVQASTLRYNAVAYTYIPLDAGIVGINSVRLPSDGRVPVHAPGRVAVIGNTKRVPPAVVSNGTVIDCGRVRLSRVRVLGHDGVAIHTGFTADLETGLVEFNDVTGYSQPVTVEHRIEDAGVVADAQVSGHIRFQQQLTHDYPVEGTYISSALLIGDMYARVSLLFDQFTWDGVTWKDEPEGPPATGTYNDRDFPIVVTNAGASTQRLAFWFTSSTSFRIISEEFGEIGTGSTAVDCSPINPNTGVPYLTIPAAGWGAGWVAGNVLRPNTEGALASVPFVRVIQQGPDSGIDYEFSVHARGDTQRP